MPIRLPMREIHLDFHTGPDVPDVGHQWDAKAFADTMVEAHVNSVTIFAKCHHGHLYYDTKHPARHPSLPKGLDLLGEQIEVLHARGIAAPIYMSVDFDEYAASEHPEWVSVDVNGKRAGASPLGAGWKHMDMGSPYQDYLAEQIEEVCKKYKPCDGFFLDICFDSDSLSRWNLDAMRKQGIDPHDEQARKRYAHERSHAYMARFKKLIDGHHGKKPCKIWFNSRPKVYLPEEKKYLRHVEIEALPTGGWGYTYFPINVRFARTFGLPTLGMTARFHKSWADFGGLKPEAALKYECTQMLAHGAACSVGDQIHPRGTLDKAAYKLIGNVYDYVERCEPWCDGAKPVTEIAVLRNVDTGYHVTPGDATEGAMRALQQLKHQFDFLPAIDTVNLRGYRLVIVPDHVNVTPRLKAKLQSHLKAGGSLLVAGQAAIGADGKPVMPELGVVSHGPSPFTTTYLRLDRAITANLPDTDHVMYDRGQRLTAAASAKALARVVEPYFERTYEHFCSHFQTPSDKLSRYAAVVQKGRAITFAHDVFTAFGTHGNVWIRHVLGNCIDRLLPEPLLCTDAPSYVEATVTQKARAMVVHLLSYCPVRRTPRLDIVEEPIVLRDVALSLRLNKPPRRVTLQPTGESIPFSHANGQCTVTVPRVDGHAMVVFE